ncbi:hypothetical protein NCS52_01499700 [Fusarium sp. LHS14.1]|nr:hypothetical protein NCS52_01499700 [Fusarium sp. LHS14.1]
MDSSQHHNDLGHRSQEPRDGQILAVPPPLHADDLRISILTRLEQYCELHSLKRSEGAQRNGSEEVDPNSSDHRAVQFRMVQSSLLRDIRELSRLTKEIECQLLSKRLRKWLIHTSLALLSHVLYMSGIPSLVTYLSYAWPTFRYRLGPVQHPSPLTVVPGTVFHILQWSGYPIALYSIATFEKGITETTSLREGLQAIEREVESGLEVQSTTCFETTTWDYITWESIRR